MTDISHQFSLSQIDHHELLKILTLRYGTCWRVSEHAISFPASPDYRLQLKVRHGQIERVCAGASLSEQELNEVLAQVQADLKDDRIAEFGAEILFAHRPVTGAFRFKSIPMKILPPPPEAPRPPAMTADHPFVLEYPIKGSQTPDVRFMRRRKNVVEWAWVLNALLYGSIKYPSSRMRQMWVIKSGESNSTPFWAQEFYIVPGFQAFKSALSAQGDPLPVVPAGSFFGDGRARATLPIDTFFLPDNFDSLVGAFLELDSDNKRRFLRSAAAIYLAGELWDVSLSSYFLACVQAIETLVDRPPVTPCQTCGKNTGPGPTQLFREFVDKYCQSNHVDQTVVQNLYSVRSALAHGSYLFQIDEAPFAASLGASVASSGELEMSRSALTLAKEGARNWLLSRG